MSMRAILLDVEGTTTPIDFVYATLFPFARARVAGFLDARRDEPEVRADVETLAAERDGEAEPGAPEVDRDDVASVVGYVEWLMDRDRKSTALKSLQGKIWREGYETGELTSEVFDDVPRAFERWRREGRRIAIYSSGSVLAQRLLFGHTRVGDLTGAIDGYFDTNVGPKIDAASYGRIAAELGCVPSEVLFVSDATAELDAAHAAGLAVALAVRPGNRPVPEPVAYPVVRSFDTVRFEES